jgi:hypothetical protein
MIKHEHMGLEKKTNAEIIRIMDEIRKIQKMQEEARSKMEVLSKIIKNEANKRRLPEYLIKGI